MTLADDLREAADQLEKEAALIDECKTLVVDFSNVYVPGSATIVTIAALDQLHRRAMEFMKKVGEL